MHKAIICNISTGEESLYGILQPVNRNIDERSAARQLFSLKIFIILY